MGGGVRMEMLQIGGVVRESIVDGPGIRMTVFTQGCSHGCEGCHNQELQPFTGGKPATVAEVLAIARSNPLLDGITISGGEPFEQAEGCAALAKAAKADGYHVMTYSGYPFEELLDGIDTVPGWRGLLEASDLLVDGPYLAAQRDLRLRFRGSRNQRILDVAASLRAGRAVEAVIAP